MLKTLIVDDEKLVRSELSHIVDWSKYNIEIVGEAENGRRALEFLEAHNVELMISDLMMPGLSGIEFLQVVRERFPRVRIVVMTMYRDFDLVQQAMRLGAIDYITKTRIEKDNFGEILGNIIKRLTNLPGEECCADYVARICLCGGDASPMQGARRLGDNMWLLSSDSVTPRDRIELKLTGVYGLPYGQMALKVRALIDTSLFYVCRPDNYRYEFDLQAQNEPAIAEREPIARRLKQTNWLSDDGEFYGILAKIPELGLNRDELTVFLYQPYLVCARYIDMPPTEYFDQTQGFKWWYQWRDWLDALRDKTMLTISPAYGEQKGIKDAVRFIEDHYREDIPLEAVLRIAALSKTRFSKLFKESTGLTFVNFVRDRRIDEARRLLSQTDMPVYQVGSRVGYDDERYFRRVFWESTGLTPAGYRKKLQSGNNAPGR